MILPPDDRYPGQHSDGSFDYENPDLCRGCGAMILVENRNLADGCECNHGRGINHGLVAKNTCTCETCDPAQTGSTRASAAAALSHTYANGLQRGLELLAHFQGEIGEAYGEVCAAFRDALRHEGER